MKTKLLILLAIMSSGCATVTVTVPEGYIETVIRLGYQIGCSEEAIQTAKRDEEINRVLNGCTARAEAFDLRQIGIYPPEVLNPPRPERDSDMIFNHGRRGGGL
jgi:hypothetical protein